MAKTVSFSKTVLAAVVAALSMGAAQAAQKEVTDVQGRKVKIESPAKRVLLGFYFEDYMAVGTEKAFDKVVGISREAWEGWRPANWALHTAHRPSLKDLPDVGEVEVQSFSVEKTLALRMERHEANATAIAQFLRSSPYVTRVLYPGHSGMVSFDLAESVDVARFLKSVRVFTFAESLGGVESLGTCPSGEKHAEGPGGGRPPQGAPLVAN